MKQSPEDFLKNESLTPLFKPTNPKPISYRVLRVLSICTDDVAKIQRKLYPIEELANYDQLADFLIHKISDTLAESVAINGSATLGNPYYSQGLAEDVKQKIFVLTK